MNLSFKKLVLVNKLFCNKRCLSKVSSSKKIDSNVKQNENILNAKRNANHTIINRSSNTTEINEIYDNLKEKYRMNELFQDDQAKIGGKVVNKTYLENDLINGFNEINSTSKLKVDFKHD